MTPGRRRTPPGEDAALMRDTGASEQAVESAMQHFDAMPEGVQTMLLEMERRHRAPPEPDE